MTCHSSILVWVCARTQHGALTASALVHSTVRACLLQVVVPFIDICIDLNIRPR